MGEGPSNPVVPLPDGLCFAHALACVAPEDGPHFELQQSAPEEKREVFSLNTRDNSLCSIESVRLIPVARPVSFREGPFSR